MQSRITVILHPNPTRVDVVLNDRFFNQERYSFSRKIEATGAELTMLTVLNNCTVGVDAAKASKNTLELEVSDGMYPSEYIPAVITAIKHFVGEKDYNPEIHCDDRRWKESPVYDENDIQHGGQKFPKGEVNIGVEYSVWNAFN